MDIMLDLETLDTTSTAVIVSIGATYFDLQSGILGDPFYVEISSQGLKDQAYKGRTINIDTIIWWMGQTAEARSVFLSNEHEKVGTASALEQFAAYATKHGKSNIWGNGMDFDNVILASCYKTFMIEQPWGTFNNRCYRTAKSMLGHKAQLEREGTYHQACDDAISQALHLIAMTRGK